MAPIINFAKNNKSLRPIVISTGQHKEILDSALLIFGFKPQYNLAVMRKNQGLSQMAGRIIERLSPIIEKTKPHLVLIQGDTTTALLGALVAFYHQIPVAHIEAGLRSFDKTQPYPEEVNRRIISTIANLHFAPTQEAKLNLRREGIESRDIFVVGNTVIDALKSIVSSNPKPKDTIIESLPQNKRIILVTTHRRENLGIPMKNISLAINDISKEFKDISFVIPMHPNPKVREVLKKCLANNPNVYLIEPLNYSDFILMMKKSYLILTDSGGVQEEAPSLGKPVLVMRETTERGEGVRAGTALLVGTDRKKITRTAFRILRSKQIYKKIANIKNPYGDGRSSQRIVKIIKKYLARSAS